MPELETPSLTLTRRRTRTYDDDRGNAEAVLQVVTQKLLPTGSIAPTYATSAPNDAWKILDGSNLAMADYPSLYAVILAAVGASCIVSATEFALPDWRGRMPIGQDGSLVSLAGLAGAATVNLTADQMPAHTHDVTDGGHTHTFTGSPHNHTITDPGHAHSGGATLATTGTAGADAEEPTAANTGSQTTGITVDNATAGGTNASATTGITVDSAGAGDDVSILPPVVGINWMIRT